MAPAKSDGAITAEVGNGGATLWLRPGQAGAQQAAPLANQRRTGKVVLLREQRRLGNVHQIARDGTIESVDVGLIEYDRTP